MKTRSPSSRASRVLRHASLSIVVAACAGPARTQGLSVVAPTSLGEGHGEPHPKRPRAPSAGSGAPAGAPAPTGSGAVPAGSSAAPAGSSAAKASEPVDPGAQPDPAPIVTPHQWDLTLHYARGTISLERVKAVELRTAASTARRMGRFAVELWVGKELVDRVRFDFPLLGADFAPSPGTHQERGAPRFSKGADTVTTVRVPASDRATSAQIVDRLSGAAVAIPWPPVESSAPGVNSP